MIGFGEQPELLLSKQGELFFKPTCLFSATTQRYDIHNIGKMSIAFKWMIPNAHRKKLSVEPDRGVIVANQIQVIVSCHVRVQKCTPEYFPFGFYVETNLHHQFVPSIRCLSLLAGFYHFLQPFRCTPLFWESIPTSFLLMSFVIIFIHLFFRSTNLFAMNKIVPVHWLVLYFYSFFTHARTASCVWFYNLRDTFSSTYHLDTLVPDFIHQSFFTYHSEHSHVCCFRFIFILVS